MICLNLPKESYWIDLPHGVRVKVRPLTTAVYEGARYDSSRRVRRLAEEMIEAQAAGGTVQGIPDLKDESAHAGFVQFLLAQSLAHAAIEEWEGVLDAESRPTPVTPERIDELMMIHTMAEEFLTQYTATYTRLIVEGTFSAAGTNGTAAAEPGIAASAMN